MDSPKATTTTNTISATAATVSLSDSPPVQESPFSNYISNLSPIKPVNTAHVAHGLLGINSPPLVFKSPHTASDRQIYLLQRFQYPQISGAETSKIDDGRKKAVDGLEDTGKSSTCLTSNLIVDAQKSDNVNNSEQDQPGSSSGCVDDYLSDPVDADCANSVNLVNSNVKKSDDALQASESNLTDLKIVESDDINDKGTKGEVSQARPEQDGEDPKEQPTSETKMEKIKEDGSIAKQPSHVCLNFGSDLLVDHASRQQCYTSGAQVAHPHEPIQLKTYNGSEVSQLQRGMSRRCLQFEQAQHEIIMDGTYPPTPAINLFGSISPASSTELEILDSSQVELTISPYKEQTMTAIFSADISGKSPLAVSKPSGIGLHLNSIVNTLPMGSSASKPTMSHHLVENKISCSKLLNLVERVSLTAGDRVLQTKASLATSPATSESFHNMEFFNNLQPPEQGCFNRPEYDETVLETRQQIESRNPLAFAPKIVQHVTEFHAIDAEDLGLFTPYSGKHKTGCNCKKSMCVKKYCECYQANVGCSNACRCEGCRNIHGRKEEYAMTQEIVSKRANEENLEGMAGEKLKMVANNKFLHAELYDLRSLTPPTPSFEYLSHGKDTPKSRLLPGRYVLSSESDFSMLPSYAKSSSSPSNSHGNDMLPNTSKTLDMAILGQELDYNSTEITGQFSPQFDGLADFSDQTPLLNPSSIMMASSASSKTQDKANDSQPQVYPGSARLSPSSSHCWRSSPITPMTRLGETKNQAQDSDCGLCDILEDDTPEILKDSSAPITSVKSSSPNKKRVSPPQSHTREFQSSSSAGLKSGRKFILKSVPSFPPLTPCLDSKDCTRKKC
ncbi:cysteine-rich polycomb family protein [Salix suchowensis]|nr:cysteine-rich polycomb family protein [Salix suchowensis]